MSMIDRKVRRFHWGRTFWLVPFLCAGAFLFGCDSTPGPGNPFAAPPRVSNLTFSPGTVNLDGPGGNTATIMATVDVTDADGDLDRVIFIVRSPDSGASAIVTEEIAMPAPGRVEAELSATFPEGATGAYALVAVAADRTGRMSNQVVGTIDIQAGGEPPQITQIDIPSTVVRPAPGEPPVSVPIVAHVSDPDGSANIARVEVTVNGTVTFVMCDDGGSGVCNSGFGSSGDTLAGDGLFTLTIQLDSTNSPGENVFEFSALDRSGLSSEPTTRTITVQ